MKLHSSSSGAAGSELPPIILASASPRRKEILRRAGLRFRPMQSGVRERPPRPSESREHYAVCLAEAKAEAILKRLRRHGIIVAADTIVCVNGEVLGKPRSAVDARRMLRRLSGRTHRVITGVVLLFTRSARRIRFAETTRVSFCRLTDKQIDQYINSGEPFDKAGAYAIQGRAGKFVSRIEGCFFNVMGLPLSRLCNELNRSIHRSG